MSQMLKTMNVLVIVILTVGIAFPASATEPDRGEPIKIGLSDLQDANGRLDTEKLRGYEGSVDITEFSGSLTAKDGDRGPLQVVGDEQWNDVPGTVPYILGNVTGTIYAIAVYQSKLTIGGDFGVKKWEGGTWVQLGVIGLPGTVYALEVYKGYLWAGGWNMSDFGAEYIWRYNGAWSSHGALNLETGFSAEVRSFTKFTGGQASREYMMVGGDFRSINGQVMNGLSILTDSFMYLSVKGDIQFHGNVTGWCDDCDDFDNEATVNAVETHDNDVIVGGDYYWDEVTGHRHILRWIPDFWDAPGETTWQGEWVSMGMPLDPCNAILSTGSHVVAGGHEYVRNYDDSDWSVDQYTVSGEIKAIAQSGGTVAVVGNFGSVGGAGPHIAQFSPSSGVFTDMGGLDSYGQVAAGFNQYIVVAGPGFVKGGREIAAYDKDMGLWGASGGLDLTTSWNDEANSMAIYQGELVVAGEFNRAGTHIVENIARWNGSTWLDMPGTGSDPLGSDITDVYAYGTDLIAAGGFDQIGGVNTFGIARWDGTAWSEMSSDNPNKVVKGFGTYQGDLIVAGGFERTYSGATTLNGIARWTGSGWVSIGGGIDNMQASPYPNATSIIEYNGDLYVAGRFESIGGVPASNIAKWDGTAWSPVGSGTDGTISRLAIWNNKLIVAGSFSSAGGLSNVNMIAAFDGTNWSRLGNGVNDQYYVRGLTVYDSKLVVTGHFHQADGNPDALSIASYNGVGWSNLGSGIDGNQYLGEDLIVYNGELYLAGRFETVGGKAAKAIARWSGDLLDPPAVSISGPSSIVEGQSGTWNSSLTAGESPVSYQWYAASDCASSGTLIGTSATVAHSAASDFCLKLTVIDADGISAEATHSVDVTPGGGGCPKCPPPMDSSEIPSTTSIVGNYPNPFNPTTAIRFGLSERAPTSLAIFNVQGKLVRSVDLGELSAGMHNWSWNGLGDNGTQVSSGVYFIRLKAGSFVDTRRATMLK